MGTLFWKMFPPFEVKLTIEEVRLFFASEPLCRRFIEPKVLSLARDAERTVYSIRVDRMKPDQLALVLITNIIGQELGSGAHHIYRGLLSLVGKDMKGMWGAAQRAMLERGYCSKEEMDKDNQWLAEQIANAG